MQGLTCLTDWQATELVKTSLSISTKMHYALILYWMFGLINVAQVCPQIDSF